MVVQETHSLLRLTVALITLVTAACGGAASTPTPEPAAATPTGAATPTTAPTPVPPTPTPATPRPKYGGSFSMRISFEPNWDSYTAEGHFSAIFIQNMANNIITSKPDDPSVTQPDLAESWSSSGDGAVWTFKLRKDPRWHDGTAFTSNDVVYSLDRARNPPDPRASAQKGRLASIKTVESVDGNTVRVVLKAPSPVFLPALTVPSLLVYPAHIPDVAGKWAERPIGTGPYAFKAYTKGISLELARSDQYFKRDATGRSLPYLDRVSFFIIPDLQTTLAAFYAGRLDCLCGYSSDLLPSYIDAARRQVPGVRIALAEGQIPMDLHFNQTPPFNDQKVRQAIHIGLDRKELNATWQLGTGLYPPTLLPPKVLGGQWSLPVDEVLNMPGFRDPKAQDNTLAKQLLQQSGINPFAVSVRIVTLAKFDSVAAVLDSQLVNLGFKRSAIFAPANPAAEIERGNFDVRISEVGGTIDDPSDPMFLVVLTNGSRNDGKWSFPELDARAEAINAEIDVAKRRALIHDFQRKLYELAIEVPLISQSIGFATAPYVEGFVLKRTFIASSAHRLEEVWLNKP